MVVAVVDVEALGGSRVVCVMVVAVADVGAVSSSDVAVGCSDVEDDMAGSTSIGGCSRNGTLNTGFSGFFKDTMQFWILASRCNGLI
uniref:Secreted protein n=1 Tax=Romanomermis culicivorax TaxID=13658 RepID=A0A915IC39_ROMCU